MGNPAGADDDDLGLLTPQDRALLRRPSVRLGFDQYELLQLLGRTFAQGRVDAQLTQRELQLRSGVEQAHISRIESGSLVQGPGLLTLVALAHALGKQLVIGLRDADPDPDAGAAAAGADDLLRF